MAVAAWPLAGADMAALAAAANPGRGTPLARRAHPAEASEVVLDRPTDLPRLDHPNTEVGRRATRATSAAVGTGSAGGAVPGLAKGAGGQQEPAGGGGLLLRRDGDAPPGPEYALARGGDPV